MTKLRNMTEITSPSNSDIVYLITDPGDTAVPKKCEINSLFDVLLNGSISEFITTLSNEGTVSSNFTALTNTTTYFTPSGSVEITLPTNLRTGHQNIVILDFTATSTSQPTITASGNILWENIVDGMVPRWNTTGGTRNVVKLVTNDDGSNWYASYYTY